MAKTTFVNGTVVMPAFLNNVFKTPKVSPKDDDGHLPLGWVDVKAYGAVGDGATDDSAAVQAAIDAAAANSCRLVFFPVGLYYLASAVTAGAMELRGIPGSSAIKLPDDDAAIICAPGAGYRLSIYGLEFYQNGGSSGDECPIWVGNNAAEIAIERCRFWEIDGCAIYAAPAFAGDLRVRDCLFRVTGSGGTRKAIHLDGGRTLISGCSFDVSATETALLVKNGIASVMVTDNHIDGGKISLIGESGSYLSGVKLHDNTLLIDGLDWEYVSCAEIAKNVFSHVGLTLPDDAASKDSFILFSNNCLLSGISGINAGYWHESIRGGYVKAEANNDSPLQTVTPGAAAKIKWDIIETRFANIAEPTITDFYNDSTYVFNNIGYGGGRVRIKMLIPYSTDEVATSANCVIAGVYVNGSCNPAAEFVATTPYLTSPSRVCDLVGEATLLLNPASTFEIKVYNGCGEDINILGGGSLEIEGL